MGGKQGLVFTYTVSEGLIAVKSAPTPELDKAKAYVLSAEQNAQYFQPLRTTE